MCIFLFVCVCVCVCVYVYVCVLEKDYCTFSEFLNTSVLRLYFIKSSILHKHLLKCRQIL